MHEVPVRRGSIVGQNSLETGRLARTRFLGRGIFSVGWIVDGGKKMYPMG